MKSETLNVRIDAGLLKEVGELLAELGLSASQAVNIYFRQIVRDRALPFLPKIHEFNAQTQSALAETSEEMGTARNAEEMLELMKSWTAE